MAYQTDTSCNPKEMRYAIDLEYNPDRAYTENYPGFYIKKHETPGIVYNKRR